MYSVYDTPKGWVAPFGYPRIKACSRLPVAFRSVPRPSSPPGAKASTECPSLAQDHSRHIAQYEDRAQYNNHSLYWSCAVELLLSTQQSSLNTIAVRWSHLPITEDRHPVRLTQTAAPRDAPKPDSPCQNITTHPSQGRDATEPTSRPARSLSITRDTRPKSHHRWWRRSGSNRRPPACKAGALPAELRPQSRNFLKPGTQRN